MRRVGVSTKKTLLVMLLCMLAFTSTYVRAEGEDLEQAQVLDGTEEQTEVLVDEVDEEAKRQ